MELICLMHLYSMMLFRHKYRAHKLFSDIELIRLYKEENNTYALPILYERYGHLVLGVCLKYLKNTQDAEDLTMNIFEALGQKLKKHDIQHFKSWLYQVTKNECYMILRKKQPKMVDEIDVKAEEDSILEAKIGLENQLELLEKAIFQLKDEQKLCVEQFFLQDKSYQEISIEYQIPLNTVKSAIQNGKRNLKIWMENHG